ncbi:transketolase [Allochromatium palmeri]|uniref:Transaldolase n=1 Tax=Allochromatium palmeri TaxID=231048 RepID=A0A6N8EEL2_9GAMM|nr:transketolase [Allochromatium palmeri]MTW21076.1 transketolase [Allochromatium palmeri]
MSRLLTLKDHGQSFWLDNLSRGLIEDGTLMRRMRTQGLSGITSNPAIFEKAMAGSGQYDERIRAALTKSDDVEAIYERLAIADVQEACDLLLPVYEETHTADGYVSLEVSPHLAHDAEATMRGARKLWQAVSRRNLYIKIPGTRAGIAATETLLYEGINITLLFGIDAYRETLQAYMRAMEERLRDGLDLRSVSSVASFFLSRIDVAVDRELRHRIDPGVSETLRDQAESLLGQAAVANARLVYADFCEVLAGHRWRHLADEGAHPQRIVWASTGTKDPDYSDVMYIEPLIGPQTVSTMPDKTADAFDAHGRVERTLTDDAADAATILSRLADLDIDLGAVTEQLVAEGVQKFIDPYDALLQGLEARCKRLRRSAAHEPLAAMADKLRAKTIRMTTAAGSGHPTSCLSCAEILAALFFEEMRWDPASPKARDVDRFLLSKGHAAPILWAALSEAGAIDSDLLSLRQLDSDLQGHPTPENPWVPVATGSLGQGLAVVNGMALANRLDGIRARLFCLLGDGECSEGSVWEAAQFAADQHLDGVVAIVDANGLEQSGPAPYGHDTSVIAGRFKAFGWRTLEIDGHDLGDILTALEQTRDAGPTAIIARTVKGQGVSFLAGAHGWHGKALDAEQCAAALAEIKAADVRIAVEPRHVVAAQVRDTRLPPGRMSVDYAHGDEVATRSAFGSALAKLGETLDDLVVLDGDVKGSTKTASFADRFPERFVAAEIAEQNMLGAAMGLAASGKRPCVATFAAFLTRAHDFMRMASYSRLEHLVICGSHAGVSIGEDGPSQMGLEDIAMLRALDATTVLYPCDAVSAERLTETAFGTPGIVYLRTTRGKTPVLYAAEEGFPVGGSKTLAESEQDVLTLVAAGITVHTALEAHAHLRERGLRTRVIDAYSVKPLDVETLQRAARETSGLLVIEDHHRAGGLGEAVAAQVGRLGRVFHLGVSGEPHSATPEALRERHRLSSQAIEQQALALAA